MTFTTPHYESLLKPLQDDCFGNLIIIEDSTAHARAIYFIHDKGSWPYSFEALDNAYN